MKQTHPTDDITKTNVVRRPAEEQYRLELDALLLSDLGPKPPGWKLSPQAVRKFILGSSKSIEGISITQKFYGNDALIDRCIVTLLGNRGLMLVGEPGTAKSMLSELLAAAISGHSTNTIQGTAGTTEDQIKYSWNYALLLADGPSLNTLVPSPIYTGMKYGTLVRFEEITRCQPEIQDSLVSILSDKILHIPELKGGEGIVYAERGFNVIGTANIRDRGVHEMSSALKRRFNFETVFPISDKALELKLVQTQTEALLADAQVSVKCPSEIIDLLVTTFHDLREGRTDEGVVIDKPSSAMSTAEAVAVGLSAGLDAYYFSNAELEAQHIARQLLGTVIKDSPEDRRKLLQYFDVVAKERATNSKAWNDYYMSRKWLKS